MNIHKVIVPILCIAVFTGCAYLKSSRTTKLKSYTLNMDEQASVGVPMITSGYATYGTATGKHGLKEEQDRWQSYEYATTDLLKEEFTYTGRTDTIIHLIYKKYRKVLSRPVSSEKLTFDLAVSDIISLSTYKVKVINATNEYIRFRVLSD